jgi:hypothetical protein
MRANRGTLTEPGKRQPVSRPQRGREPRLFRADARRRIPDGAHVLRARIDMASPNINLRDPALYRIRHAHHRTGDKPGASIRCTTTRTRIEDALENITHSLCTLEFEDQRPFYDWLLDKLADGGCFARPLPQQIRVRAPQPHLRRALQAQADPAGGGRARRRLGRPAHADAGRRAPPRLHARGLPQLHASASACRRPTPGSTWACSKTACATT